MHRRWGREPKYYRSRYHWSLGPNLHDCASPKLSPSRRQWQESALVHGGSQLWIQREILSELVSINCQLDVTHPSLERES